MLNTPPPLFLDSLSLSLSLSLSVIFAMGISRVAMQFARESKLSTLSPIRSTVTIAVAFLVASATLAFATSDCGLFHRLFHRDNHVFVAEGMSSCIRT